MRMLANVYDSVGRRMLGTVEAEAECGEAFCDQCGDCLECYADQSCTRCVWVVYAGDDVDWLLSARKEEA
jgi:hypothetical protein